MLLWSIFAALEAQIMTLLCNSAHLSNDVTSFYFTSPWQVRWFMFVGSCVTFAAMLIQCVAGWAPGNSHCWIKYSFLILLTSLCHPAAIMFFYRVYTLILFLLTSLREKVERTQQGSCHRLQQWHVVKERLFVRKSGGKKFLNPPGETKIEKVNFYLEQRWEEVNSTR